MSEQDITFEKFFPRPLAFADKAHELEMMSKWNDAKITWETSLEAATAEAKKRIEALEARHERDISEYTAMREVNAELQASNNHLREAINEAISTYNLPVTARLAESLSATPAESLQAFENSVIEKIINIIKSEIDKFNNVDSLLYIIEILDNMKVNHETTKTP